MHFIIICLHFILSRKLRNKKFTQFEQIDSFKLKTK